MVCEQSSAAVIDQHPVVVQQIRAVLLCVLGDDPDQAAVSLGCDVSFRISRHWLIIYCCNTNTSAVPRRGLRAGGSGRDINGYGAASRSLT